MQFAYFRVMTRNRVYTAFMTRRKFGNPDLLLGINDSNTLNFFARKLGVLGYPCDVTITESSFASDGKWRLFSAPRPPGGTQPHALNRRKGWPLLWVLAVITRQRNLWNFFLRFIIPLLSPYHKSNFISVESFFISLSNDVLFVYDWWFKGWLSNCS